MVSFAEPERLSLLLLPAVAAVLVVLRHRVRLSQQRRLASPAVWQRLMGGPPATGLVRLLLWTSAAALVALALARPQWGDLPGEESIRTRDLVFALDVSDSMLCPDVRPSRLSRSLEEIQRSLPRLAGNRVAVVIFAGDAYPLVPLTTDLQAVATFLSGVEVGMVGLPGSNLERAVRVGLELLPEEGDGRVVVLFTDGENLQGNIELAAGALKDAGVGAIGVVSGTEAGGPIPVTGDDGNLHYKTMASGQPVVTRARRDLLEALTEPLDGRVLELNGGNAALELVAAVEQVRTREIEARRRVLKVERFPLFLAAAAVLLTAGFALSPWRRGALPVLLLVVALVVGAEAPALAQGPGQAPAGQPVVTSPGQMAPAPASRGAEEAADSSGEAAEELQQVAPSWWQRLVPGGSRRMARSGAAAWDGGRLEGALKSFLMAWKLDPASRERQYDLGTTLAATGRIDEAVPLMQKAHEAGVKAAAFNLGTAALEQGRAEQAVQWLREALIASPNDLDVKHNYELALRLLQQQENESQDENQDNENENDQQEKDESQGQPTPTPTPQQQPGGGSPEPTPTPTPASESALYAALERAEAEARKDLQTPTPLGTKVEKDW